LCYFGDLAPAAAAFARTLNPGGVLIFTVETQMPETEAGVTAQNNGRYVHGENYVRRILGEAGLDVVTLENAKLRMEMGKPVQGFVVRAMLPRQR
jgi:predicted TPR repeat methyltransferase